MNHQQSESSFDTVIVRFAGEIGVKAAWTRKLYERRLISNIKAVLKQHAILYEFFNRQFGRLYIKTSDAQRVAEELARVFGISSVSPAQETTSNLNDIANTSVQVAGSTLKKGNSFAVQCRRIGKHAYSSQDVCREVGRRILEAYSKLNLRVDLTYPEVAIGVEVRDDKTFVFTESIRGAGGLPLGTQPKLVCLLKGDLNSTVACWLTMKRGCQVVLLHFDAGSFGCETSSADSALEHSQALSEWMIGFPRKLQVVSFNSKSLAEIIEKYPQDLNLFRKRFMLKLAERMAEIERAEGIVTGEILSDENCQALNNLRIEDEAVDNYPIYRPLLSLDKPEIQRLAQKIGIKETYATVTSKRKTGLRRNKHATVVKLEDVKRLEESLGTEEMIEASLRELKTLNYSAG